MNAGRAVFSQLMDFLPRVEFDECVERYRGNWRVRSFSCLDQFLCMAFAQLTCRESLRDIETCLRSLQPKLYHVGIRGAVFAKHLGQCQRDEGLANLRRLCPRPQRQSQDPLCNR